MELHELIAGAKGLAARADALDLEIRTRQSTKNNLMQTAEEMRLASENDSLRLTECEAAIALLSNQSEEIAESSYKFLEANINASLARIFTDRPKAIHIEKGTIRNTPTLEFQMIENGSEAMSLREDSGHGVEQVVSLLSVLCLICINGSRRFLILDEVMSGMDADTRRVINDILWGFTKIGFQFIICEHGFIPEGSYVHLFEQGRIKRRFICEHGVYLDGKSIKTFGSGKDDTEQEIDEDVMNAMMDGKELYVPVGSALAEGRVGSMQTMQGTPIGQTPQGMPVSSQMMPQGAFGVGGVPQGGQNQTQQNQPNFGVGGFMPRNGGFGGGAVSL